MNVAIVSDHNGVLIKQFLIEHLKHERKYFDIQNLYGYPETSTTNTVDYPVLVPPVADALFNEIIQRAVVICGGGGGVAVAANRFSHIRCVNVNTREKVVYARQHGDCNVLALASNYLKPAQALALVSAFLKTEFKPTPIYQNRLQQLATLPNALEVSFQLKKLDV